MMANLFRDVVNVLPLQILFVVVDVLLSFKLAYGFNQRR